MQFRNKLKGIITKIFGQLDDATGDIIEEDGG
jgi:hypothetical protein